MSIRSHQDYDNKWKEKYLQLLDEQRAKFKQTHENEDLLCKTIIRLTLAAKGYNKQLDPYLDRIQQSVKSGLSNTQLKTEIDELAKAVKQFDRNNAIVNESDNALLFDYLITQFSDEVSVRAIKSLQKRYLNNEFNSNDSLFAALFDITATVGTIAATPSVKENPADQIDTETVCDQMLLLLDNLIIPFEFEDRAAHLKVRLKNNSASHTFGPLLNDYVTLLVNIKKHILSEQKDIEDFLSDLTEQLTELGFQAIGATNAEQQSNIDRKRMNQYVSAQMKELKHSSDNATTLDHLKLLINTRLESIARQIHLHHSNEEKQRLQTQQKLSYLSKKIAQMESEANELKLKLALEHDKALRDPLTGLANRIAYDERLITECARWQRYQSPLSLVICDVDNFKRINDTFGHKAGDKTLKIIAQILAHNCRKCDFLCRFGGEEFVLLLPDSSQEAAIQLADKLRIIIEKSPFNHGRKNITITISCGISEFREGDTPEMVFERADQALYNAKNSGRNLCLLG